MSKEFWDDRYKNEVYAYGEAPNEFLKSWLEENASVSGKALFPCEGEGRNAVYAASRGFKSFAFDISEEGKNKCKSLSSKHQVQVDYKVNAIQEIEFPANEFDFIFICYCHFPPPIKEIAFERFKQWLKPGGYLVAEVFDLSHQECQKLNPQVGGPPEAALLYSPTELAQLLEGLKIHVNQVESTYLKEGVYHVGPSKVVRVIAQK